MVSSFDFELAKKQALLKKDKSRKQSIDADIKDLIDFLNAQPWCFTTSSCSGRLILLEEHYTRKKHLTRWWLVSHEPLSFESFKKGLSQALQNKQEKNLLWFKMEGFILHVVVKDLTFAKRLLRIARDVGFKHSGLISFTNKLVLEIRDSEALQVLITHELPETFLKQLLSIANEKLLRTKARIEKFFKALKQSTSL